ncbi:unnamed protein product [Effrenium voratum]|nr:unnamed protein product [Effrenium voratum]
MPREATSLAERFKDLQSLSGEEAAPTRLKAAVQSAKALYQGTFADVLPVMQALAPTELAHHSAFPFLIIVLAEVCLLRRFPSRPTPLTVENPLALLGTSPLSFEMTVKGSFLHAVSKKDDVITRAGHIILHVLGSSSRLRNTLLLVIGFMRSSHLACWMAKRVFRGMQAKDVLYLVSSYKQMNNPWPAKRFLPDRVLWRRCRAKQVFNTDLQGYTLASVLGASATYLFDNIDVPAIFDEDSLLRLLGATAFWRGKSLMLPHLHGWFLEWNLWTQGGDPDLKHKKLGTNTRKFFAAAKMKEREAFALFHAYVRSAPGLTPGQQEEMAALTSADLRAMACKTVCVVENFGGAKVSNWMEGSGQVFCSVAASKECLRQAAAGGVSRIQKTLAGLTEREARTRPALPLQSR